MKNLIFLLLAIPLLNVTACRRNNVTPIDNRGNDTTHHDTVSNSTFTNGELAFYRWKLVIRDSVTSEEQHYIYAGADINGTPFSGSIFINDYQLAGPDPHAAITTGHLYNRNIGGGNGNVYKFDTAKWKILSANNFTDMQLNIPAYPLYGASIPYFISLSSDLNVPLDAGQYPNADSIRLMISVNNTSVETTLHNINGTITLTASQLSAIPANGYPYGVLSVQIYTHGSSIINNRQYSIFNSTYTAYDICIKP